MSPLQDTAYLLPRESQRSFYCRKLSTFKNFDPILMPIGGESEELKFGENLI